MAVKTKTKGELKMEMLVVALVLTCALLWREWRK